MVIRRYGVSWLAWTFWVVFAGAMIGSLMLRAPFYPDHSINSDSLFGAEWAWAVHRDVRALSSFPWSRVPSPFDMAYFLGFEALGLGWRWAFFLYGYVAVAALTVGIAAIATQIRGKFHDNLVKSAALMAVVAVCWIACDATGLFRWQNQLLRVLTPINHGNGFMIALAATACAASRPRIVTGLCFLGTLCDLQFAAIFTLPYVLSHWICRRPKPHPGHVRPWLQAITSTTAALAVQYHLPLSGLGYLPIALMSEALSLLINDVIWEPWYVTPLVGTLWLVGRTLRAYRRAPQDDATLTLMIASISALASIGCMLMMYYGVASWRYALSAIWMPLAMGVVHMPRLPIWTAAGAFILGLPLTAGQARSFPVLRTSLERCISSIPKLRGGLGDYWQARSTSASSDWGRQIAPINATGIGRAMNTDAVLHRQDSHDRDKPARFNFIIVDEAVTPREIERRYGKPQRKYGCPGAQIWAYDHWLRIERWSG